MVLVAVQSRSGSQANAPAVREKSSRPLAGLDTAYPIHHGSRIEITPKANECQRRQL